MLSVAVFHFCLLLIFMTVIFNVVRFCYGRMRSEFYGINATICNCKSISPTYFMLAIADLKL